MLDWGLRTKIIRLLMFRGSKIQCMIWSKISTVFHFCGHDSFRAYRINQQNTYSKRRFGSYSSVLMIDNLGQLCWDDYDLTKKKLSPAIGINDHECWFVGPIHILKHKIQWLCWNSFEQDRIWYRSFYIYFSASVDSVPPVTHVELYMSVFFKPHELLSTS